MGFTIIIQLQSDNYTGSPNTSPNQSPVSVLSQKLSELMFLASSPLPEDPQSLPGLAEGITSLKEATQNVQQALSGYKGLHWLATDENKEKYQVIVCELKMYIDRLFNALPPVQDTKKSEQSFDIPFEAPNIKEDTHFVQREYYNKLLKSQIGQGARTGNINQVVLYGTGGVGKSHLAANYVLSCRKDYSAIFWVNAASEQTIKLAFTNAMQRLIDSHAQFPGYPPPDSAHIGGLLGMTGHVLEAVKQWLASEGNTRWLLIFDNLDDLESFNINNYIPSCRHGTIIITSRRRESLLTRRGFEVQHMQRNDAKMLLLQSSHRELKHLPDNGM